MFQLAALIATTALIRKRRRIEREKFYRLPSDVLQVAKVTQILLATENGAIKNLGGKTLYEINDKNFEFAGNTAFEFVQSINVILWTDRPRQNPLSRTFNCCHLNYK